MSTSLHSIYNIDEAFDIFVEAVIVLYSSLDFDVSILLFDIYGIMKGNFIVI